MDELKKAVKDLVWSDNSQADCDQSSGAQNKDLDGAFGKVTLDEESQVKDDNSEQALNKDCDEALGEVMLAERAWVKHHQFLSAVKELMLKRNTKLKYSSLDIALQMYVVKAIRKNDPSLFVWLFEIGISPDFFTQLVPFSFVSLLEEAVHKKSHDVIKVLMDNDVNFNEGEGYLRCHGIMCLVLLNDNPTLMELFLPKYDRSRNNEGKSLLYKACQFGAYRCAEVLLQRHRGDTNLAEISFSDCMKNRAMVISVLCRAEGAVYTPDELGFCLLEALDWKNVYGNKRSLYDHYEEDRIGYIDLLLSCGANVNLESPCSTGNVTPLEQLMSPTYGLLKTCPPSLLEKALSLLLFHGSIAHWQRLNQFLSGQFYNVMCRHDISLSFLSIMSTLYSKEHFKQIKGPMVDCEIGQRSSEWSTLLQEEVRHVSSKNEQKKGCILNPEIIRLAFLYLDINVVGFSLCYPPTLSTHCTCMKYGLSLLASTLKYSDYQKFIRRTFYEKYSYTVLHALQLSDMRSLKDRTRAIIINSLCRPRALSIKELPLPQCLQAYLCLKY